LISDPFNSTVLFTSQTLQNKGYVSTKGYKTHTELHSLTLLVVNLWYSLFKFLHFSNTAEIVHKSVPVTKQVYRSSVLWIQLSSSLQTKTFSHYKNFFYIIIVFIFTYLTQ